jgi:hypothetical protein
MAPSFSPITSHSPVFDGPFRAIRCADRIVEAVWTHGRVEPLEQKR